MRNSFYEYFIFCSAEVELCTYDGGRDAEMQTGRAIISPRIPCPVKRCSKETKRKEKSKKKRLFKEQGVKEYVAVKGRTDGLQNEYVLRDLCMYVYLRPKRYANPSARDVGKYFVGNREQNVRIPQTLCLENCS